MDLIKSILRIVSSKTPTWIPPVVSIVLLGCSVLLWVDPSLMERVADRWLTAGKILLYGGLPGAIGLMAFTFCRDYSSLLNKKSFPFVIHSFDKDQKISSNLTKAVGRIFKTGTLIIEDSQIKLAEDWQEGFHTYWREKVFEQLNQSPGVAEPIDYADVNHDADGETTLSVSRNTTGLKHRYLLAEAHGTVKHTLSSQVVRTPATFNTEFRLIRNSSISVNLFKAIWQAPLPVSEFEQWLVPNPNPDNKKVAMHPLTVVTRLKVIPTVLLHESLYLYESPDHDGFVPIAIGVYKN